MSGKLHSKKKKSLCYPILGSFKVNRFCIPWFWERFS